MSFFKPFFCEIETSYYCWIEDMEKDREFVDGIERELFYPK